MYRTYTVVKFMKYVTKICVQRQRMRLHKIPLQEKKKKELGRKTRKENESEVPGAATRRCCGSNTAWMLSTGLSGAKRKFQSVRGIVQPPVYQISPVAWCAFLPY